MFGWLFGKRRKVLFRFRCDGETRIVTVRKRDCGWVGSIWPHGMILLLDNGNAQSAYGGGTWKPYSGWPLAEFPVVPLENAK